MSLLSRSAVPTRLLAGTLAVLLLAGGCSLPRVHKVTVQQGNVITQDMIDRLKPGMTRSQVAFVMGEPVFRNAFDDDRWDYIYTLEVPGYYEEQKVVSLYFEDGVLAYFTGDYAPSGETEAAEPSTASADVEGGGEDAAQPL
jgi:outer membrane protein assembly factor BamE